MSSSMGRRTAHGRGRLTGAALAPADGRSAPSPVPVSKDATEDVEALIAELREAARHAGIQRDDPMMPLLTTLAHQIRFLANRTATSDRVATETSARIIDALQQSRQAADTEIARFQAGIAETEAVTIERIADSIAKTADRALTRRVAVFQWQLVLGAAGVLVLVAASCLGGGYWWGRDNTLASVHETETGLQTAFEQGAGAAQKWLNLMQWNPITDALGQCTGALVSMQDGRKACNVPLWIEPPHPGPPPQQ
ncbi:hypothetical protein ACELLULO517_27615 [Acidisoma cellulosilytica]|uniref:Uncharacterized protein n=1 Tax=Acidisoma cellulosilyticum TaxID=2802395 RepID=A0A963Z7P7_9PROT|nr:hypothetical protein [Acidisoma cellulosilyticum]MCB8884034.1 hypothetical protein [Acidisoma cellulosilyticum]